MKLGPKALAKRLLTKNVTYVPAKLPGDRDSFDPARNLEEIPIEEWLNRRINILRGVYRFFRGFGPQADQELVADAEKKYLDFDQFLCMLKSLSATGRGGRQLVDFAKELLPGLRIEASHDLKINKDLFELTHGTPHRYMMQRNLYDLAIVEELEANMNQLEMSLPQRGR